MQERDKELFNKVTIASAALNTAVISRYKADKDRAIDVARNAIDEALELMKG